MSPFLRLLVVAGSVLTAGHVACADGLPHNWPMSPSELEQRFAGDTFEIQEVQGAGGGVTGASRLRIEFPDGRDLNVKWKAVPGRSADGWNNSPRKELATYEMQRWLVDPDDFVVPTSAAYCIPLAAYAPIDPKAHPSVPGTSCVLGVLSAWLDDVSAPKKFHDEGRFVRDHRYARYMADFNLLTYLADHRDGRRGNLLLSNDESDPRVFAVDNGISFGPFPWNFLVPNWNKIRVAWLRRATVERLRSVDDAALARLGVVAEMAPGDDGVLRAVDAGENLDPRDGVRFRGGRVQFGLTSSEIDDVRERIADLFEKVDAGKIELR